MIEIDVNNQQSALPVDQTRLCEAVQNVLGEAGIRRGEVSIAVVDDREMQQLNARYLDHDWPTDVLSFVHDADQGWLEGEIIVSADTALRQAARFGWSAADELLLYVIHGALHLIGHDDHRDEDRAAMRAAERRHLRVWGLSPPYDEDDGKPAQPQTRLAAGEDKS